MAFDRTRNAAYAAAIRRVVTPDSVVLDLGAGLGVHGLLAAAAGARKVYLVEPEPVIHAAREAAARSGLADKIVPLQGRIEDIELPEKVDVIISVFTGNALYSEDLLPSLFHARERWLKPDGHLIPDVAELMIAPVSAPRLHAEAVASWSTPHFGLDYSSLRRFAANQFYFERRDAFKPELLAPALALVSADLSTANSTDCDARLSFVASDDGECSGVMAWIRIRLGEAWLGTGPDDPPVHWTPQFLPIDPELSVKRGDEIAFHLHRPAYGDWTWTLQIGSEKRRQSTFMAQPRSLADLRKLAPDFKGRSNERAGAVKLGLALLDGSRTNDEIATAVREAFPRQFPDAALASSFVRNLAAKYAD